MSKIVALFAILAILSGAVILAVPRQPEAVTRGPGVTPTQNIIAQVREIADQVNAPLSIVFGLISLYYTRRTYLAQAKK
jgi:hypothetical protein